MSGYLAHPPPGVEPDWSSEGWASGIQIVVIILIVLNTLFVSARLYTRAVVLKAFGVDDCFIMAAWAMITAEFGLALNALQYGFGRHSYDVPKYKAPGLYRSYFILGLLPGPIYWLTKMAFFLTYARVFNRATYMRWLIWGGVAVITAFYLGDFLYDLFQCQPIAKAWNPTLEGHCAKESVPGGPTGIFNVISDIYILVLPIHVILSLNMHDKVRIKVLLVFSLGIFTCAMSLTRLAATAISARNPDKTYVVGRIYLWSSFEWSVGLMVVCMIVSQSLWDRVLSKQFSDSWSRISSVFHSVFSGNSDRVEPRRRGYEMDSDISKTTTITQATEDI